MKKGASAIVAWVLLLGFTIALATTIFYWTKSQATEMTEHTVEFVTGQMECQDISINVYDINTEDNTFKIKNKGLYYVSLLYLL